jgi:hypothetical protein
VHECRQADFLLRLQTLALGIGGLTVEEESGAGLMKGLVRGWTRELEQTWAAVYPQGMCRSDPRLLMAWQDVGRLTGLGS